MMLASPEKEEFDHPASIIYYKVEDIQVAHSELSKRGATFESEPAVVHRTEDTELWMAFLRDPDNNVLALMSESP